MAKITYEDHVVPINKYTGDLLKRYQFNIKAIENAYKHFPELIGSNMYRKLKLNIRYIQRYYPEYTI